MTPIRLTPARGRRLLFLLLLLSCLGAGKGFAQAPHIDWLSVNGASSGEAVQIHGSHLTGVTAVRFGAVNATSFTINYDSMITAVVGGGASGYVSVWSPNGVDSQAGFTYFPTILPARVDSFSPKSGGPGAVILLYGVRLNTATAVRFGGVPAASFTILSDTVIRAVVGYGNTGAVTVISPGGNLGVFGFLYLPPPGAIKISYFSPQMAKTGDLVQIHGVSFNGVNAVRFGGVAAQTFTVGSDTLITAQVAAGASGQVWISGPQGMDSLAGFVYQDTSTAPRVYTVLHSYAPASGGRGTTVMLHGAGLTWVNSVSFGGVAAKSFSVLSDTLLSATVGNGASGLVYVRGSHGLDSLPGFRYVDSAGGTPPPGDTVKPAFQLVTLQAMANGTHPRLLWTTLYDEPIAAYEVDRAPDSTHFNPAGVVSSLRVDTAAYTFTDSIERTGMNFYRLRYIRATGGVDSSYIVAISVPGAMPTLSGFPNPAPGSMVMPVPQSATTSKITVTDMSGNVVRTIIVPPNAGPVRVDLHGLNKGVYKIVWSNGSSSAYQTVLVWN
ncbi:MAG TPA: T9SS type A sorting domain-containing protein [Puia sp.]|uniref:T9SS type A sorting domain-containing protein n=1 Tax=Puia sp. TaxID=2045100 RepID=UPI002C5A2898|nr:T9SS type A sorting domain-containing protein [Puia sp.]HVU95342.1 T9SS type A sorting domain-containing protein [Puia sp.]